MNDQSIISQAQQDSGTDNEVCEINDTKAQLEKNVDFMAMSANTQVCACYCCIHLVLSADYHLITQVNLN